MKKLTIKKNSTLKEALLQLNFSGEKCLIVTNYQNKLIGTLSDGDLRKKLLTGVNLNEKILKIFNNNPTFFYEDEYDINKVKKIFIDQKYALIPLQLKPTAGSGLLLQTLHNIYF